MPGGTPESPGGFPGSNGPSAPSEAILPASGPSGDPGPSFGRDCSLDPTFCEGSAPVCRSGSDRAFCTSTCAYGSDCPLGTCCRDVQGDGSPEATLCVSEVDCGPWDPSIPRHRPCGSNAECPLGGACVAGFCYSAGGAKLAQPGEPCTTPSDCDLGLADHCLQRMDDGAWIAGDSGEHPIGVHSECAFECEPGGICPQGSCCRIAWIDNQAPRAFCVDELVPGNCGLVSSEHAPCDVLNPTTCDPAETNACVFFERETGAESLCAKDCSSSADCGGGAACCGLSVGRSYCVLGAGCP